MTTCLPRKSLSEIFFPSWSGRVNAGARSPGASFPMGHFLPFVCRSTLAHSGGTRAGLSWETRRRAHCEGNRSMTEPIIITSPPERPPHNRRKVYVDGDGGARVPFVEVTLSDSPGRNGAEPNPPVRLYDTSGPGSVPTVGLPTLRRPWITGRRDVAEYEGRPVNRRDDGRAALRRDGDGPAPFPLDGRRPLRSA